MFWSQFWTIQEIGGVNDILKIFISYFQNDGLFNTFYYLLYLILEVVYQLIASYRKCHMSDFNTLLIKELV